MTNYYEVSASLVPGFDDGAAVNQAIAECCAEGKALVMSGAFNLRTGIVVPNGVAIRADPRAVINAEAFTGALDAGAMTFQGCYSSTSHVLPEITGSPGAAMRIVNCALQDIYVGRLSNCGVGILFDSGEYTSNNRVRAMYIGEMGLNYVNWTGSGVLFRSITPGGMQGNKVQANFSNHNRNHVLFFTQGPANQDSNIVVFDSLDVNAVPDARVVRAYVGAGDLNHASYRQTVIVNGWFGGFAEDTRIIDGTFCNLRARFYQPANPLPPQAWTFNHGECFNDVKCGGMVI